MSMARQQTGFLRRLRAYITILLGVAFLACSMQGIVWNEHHAVNTTLSLQQIAADLIPIVAVDSKPQNNFKLVYLTGTATTTDKLIDNLFGVSENAIKLDRRVLMYQWHETETKPAQSYDYQPIWSEDIIDSHRFKQVEGHQNPGTKPIESLYQAAAHVSVGAFTLSPDLVDAIHDESTSAKQTFQPAHLQAVFNKTIKQANNYFYIGKSEASPMIGDLRVYLNIVKPQTVSIIALQSGTELLPYITPTGEKIRLIAIGQVPAAALLHEAATHYQSLTWGLRVGTWLGMVIGMAWVVFGWLLIREQVSRVIAWHAADVGFAALLSGLLLWGIVTAMVWSTLHPDWSLPLMTVICGVCFLLLLVKRYFR